MNKRWILIFLAVALAFSGCSYAPGNERKPFIEKWLELPQLELNEYQSNKEHISENNGASESTEATEAQIAIAAPVVNYDELPDRGEADFVRVKDYIPDIVQDVKYASSNNFTGYAVYDFTDVYLRYGTVLKLMKVQEELRQQGLLLKIWDSYRTLDAQKTLWEKSGGKGYSNPETGNNSHSRGNTLDVTLVDAKGNELEMPTGHDEFTSYADRDYADCTDTAAANARLLEEIMEKHGFKGLSSEWWQFSDTVEYDVEKYFDPGEIALYFAKCEEFIHMRSGPSYDAGDIETILVNEHFTLLGWADNGFALIEYEGRRGYVNTKYIGKVE